MNNNDPARFEKTTKENLKQLSTDHLHNYRPGHLNVQSLWIVKIQFMLCEHNHKTKSREAMTKK